jgi:hypothetical protein
MMSLLLALLAQSATVIVQPNQPFALGWYVEAAASQTDTWRLWCGAAIVYNFKSADLTKTPRSDGNVDIVAKVPTGIPAPAIGSSLTCSVGATNPFWTESGQPDVQSEPATILIGNPPVKPLGVTFVVTVKSGGL